MYSARFENIYSNRSYEFTAIKINVLFKRGVTLRGLSEVSLAAATPSWLQLWSAIQFSGTYNTGRFIMFSVITNIYNKKTKGPTLMEFFTATGKLKKFFFLTSRYIRCVYHGWHGTRRYDIQVLATHASTDVCRVIRGAHIEHLYLSKKKYFFSFSVAVKNSIKVGPLVFLL